MLVNVRPKNVELASPVFSFYFYLFFKEYFVLETNAAWDQSYCRFSIENLLQSKIYRMELLRLHEVTRYWWKLYNGVRGKSNTGRGRVKLEKAAKASFMSLSERNKHISFESHKNNEKGPRKCSSVYLRLLISFAK